MDELKKIAPNLSKLKKDNPFSVPKNYFDDFPARLQMKMNEEKNGAVKQENKIIKFLKPSLGLAAAFALIFMLAYWPMKTFTQKHLANNNNMEEEINDMLYASMVEGIDVNSFYDLLDDTNGSSELSDEDLANFVNTYSSDYEIFSETNN
jgi:hypothetical protein